LQKTNLHEGTDKRLLKNSGKVFTTRDAYATLDCHSKTPDIHGHHIWGTRLPNKVKVFAWLYFKDRLSTRANLFAKHVLDEDACQRCSLVALKIAALFSLTALLAPTSGKRST
jgi:hypothetical protein